MIPGVEKMIRASRAYGDVSREQLGSALEVSLDTIKRIEVGTRKPKRGELMAIAEVTHVPLWFLERGWDGWQDEETGA